MREILFKAKRKDNDEWVEGYYSKDPDLKIHYISSWNYYYTEGGLEREPFDYEIIPYTLCEYTGMKDKNGNKIWENDIVKRPNERLRHPNTQVVWYQPDLCFYFVDIENWHEAIYQDSKDKIEVIGNVFDNPELLEVEE